MGRRLDILLPGALGFIAIFFIAHYAGKTGMVCFLSATAAFVSISTLLSRLIPRHNRVTRSFRRVHADRQVKNLIYLDAAEAHEAAYDLLSKKYPLSGGAFANGHMRCMHLGSACVILHILQKLRASPDDIVSAWRQHGKPYGAESLIVLVPGKSDNDIRVAAARLTSPGVVILDRHQLRAIYMKYKKPGKAPDIVHRMHLIRSLKGFIARRRFGRYFLYALMMIVYYVLSGRFFYLMSGLVIMLMAILCLYRPKEPESLV